MKKTWFLIAAFFIVGKITIAQGWVQVGTSLPSVADVDYTIIKFDSAATPFVSFTDNGIQIGSSFYYGKASVMKYNGNSWVQVGTKGFSPNGADIHTFAIAPNGTPFTAFEDFDGIHSSYPPRVMRYDGSSWVSVGSFPPSTNSDWTAVAIDNNNTPYIVYSEPFGCCHLKTTVMKFDGNNWVLVGNRGFSPEDALQTGIAIDGNGIPYVIFEDRDSGQIYGHLTAMKYDGNSWVIVGNRNFTAGFIDRPDMAIDKNGNLYVVYKNYLSAPFDGKATVMKYDGNNWATVGGATLPAGSAVFATIAIDNAGIPFVAFSDSLNGYKATVMKYDGNNWVTIGSAGFSVAKAYYTCIAIDPKGTPYVVYQDLSVGAGSATVMKYVDTTTPTDINNLPTASHFTIRPNPSAGVFRVWFTEKTTGVQVYDVQGRLVTAACNGMDENNFTIDLTGKARGVYFLRATTLNGILNGKLVLE